ncbi:hypothetical protein HN51_055222, partial [Arachis hypogaea]
WIEVNLSTFNIVPSLEPDFLCVFVVFDMTFGIFFVSGWLQMFWRFNFSKIKNIGFRMCCRGKKTSAFMIFGRNPTTLVVAIGDLRRRLCALNLPHCVGGRRSGRRGDCEKGSYSLNSLKKIKFVLLLKPQRNGPLFDGWKWSRPNGGHESDFTAEQSGRVIDAYCMLSKPLSTSIYMWVTTRLMPVFTYDVILRIVTRFYASTFLCCQRLVIFPLVWTNTCCSHPLYRESVLIEKDALEVSKAAQRKLLDDLGIVAEDVTVDHSCNWAA